MNQDYLPPMPFEATDVQLPGFDLLWIPAVLNRGRDDDLEILSREFIDRVNQDQDQQNLRVYATACVFYFYLAYLDGNDNAMIPDRYRQVGVTMADVIQSYTRQVVVSFGGEDFAAVDLIDGEEGLRFDDWWQRLPHDDDE
jgi:hypothetical protein